MNSTYKFSPSVEKYRAYVEEFWPAGTWDKALWTMSGESGGNANALGDEGRAIGLFQIQTGPGRPNADQLADPVFNIRYAAYLYKAAGNKWTDWGGDGALYNGKPYGALGNHPFPGDNELGGGQTGGSVPATFGLPGVPSGFSFPDITDFNPLDPLGITGIGNPFNLFTSPADIASSVTDIANTVKTTATYFIKIMAWLVDPHHWFRLFFIIGGSIMVGFGLYLYVRGDAAINDAVSAVKVSEVAAAA